MRANTIYTCIRIELAITVGAKGIELVVNLNKMLLESVATIQRTLLIHRFDKRKNILNAGIVKFLRAIMQKVC